MRKFVAAILLLLPAIASGQDCTCGSIESKPQWLRAMYQASTYVFSGRVDSIAPPLPGSNEVRDQPTVTPLHHYKGNFPGGELRGADCGSSVLPSEAAIFFVDGYSRIKSCSIGVKGITPQQVQSGVFQLSRDGT